MQLLSHIGTFTGLPLWQPVGSAEVFMTGFGSSLRVNVIDYGSGLTSQFTVGANALGSSTGQIIHSTSQTAIVTGSFSGSVLTGALSAALSGPGASVTAYLGAGGAFSERVELASATVSGQTCLFAAQSDGSGFSVLSANGTAQPAWIADIADTTQSYSAGITAMVTATIGGRTFLFTGSATESGISGYEVTAGGGVTRVESIGVHDLVPLETISEMRTVTVAGATYLIAAAATNSSLTVMEIGAGGTLTPTDHVIDDLATRFQSVAVMDALTVSGRAFITAAGADGGLSLFTLLPGGKLIHLQSIADSAATTLMNVSAVEMTLVGSEIQVFVTSGAEAGMTLFRVDLSAVGLTLTGAGSSLTGGSGDDMLVQTSGNGMLSGGGGDDILCDGSGSDQLRGGAGADRFVMVADGVADTILDYQPGVDRIDLTLWPYLRNIGQLTIQSTATGAVISYGSEVLTVQSYSGQSLTAADFPISSMLNLTRFPITRGVPVYVLQGTNSAEQITGTPDAEFFMGLGGDDTLVGGGGADQFDGGDGFDVVSFATLTSGLILDLTLVSAPGSGPVFISIEGIIGSNYADTIRCGGLADQLWGQGGADELWGGGGNDTLLGGDGDDTLNGGSGGDVLNGGNGIDTVSYEGSVGSLRVDLMFSSINTNIAAGDTYVSIENLIGSQGSDNLRGTTGANLIEGMANVDWLFGRAGNDTLVGGIGDDVLLGGVGADVLDGGTHRDRAQYSESLTALVIDLLNPANNTGEAAGDVYISIEDLAGGNYDDTISGDNGANRLFGRDGADILSGRDGDDYLNGGAHGDRLDGGAGNDTLRGGTHVDTFVFNAGADVIEDFTIGAVTATDTIEFASTLWGGGAMTGADIVAAYASVIGGHVVFDFGAGNTLTLLSQSSTTGLDAHIYSV
ncbi:MAG: hypothetical protein KDE03_15215 [Rhodobacteraceae bacterium]|nr:hypothetical protein [Paracoccaceae bacterium]